MTATALSPYLAVLPGDDAVPFYPSGKVFRLSPRALALILVASAFAGCPSGPRGPDIGRLPLITSDDPEAEAELRHARELADAGNDAAAAQAYESFLEHRATDPLVPVAELALGRIHLKAGRYAEAKKLLARVAAHRDPSVAEQGRFYGAVADHHLGNNARAVEVLDPMVGRTIDPEDTALLLQTLAAAKEQLGDVAGAIRILDALAAESVSEAQRKHARTRIRELVNERASANDVQVLYRELPEEGAAWPHVLRRAIRDADSAGDAERVRQLVEVARDNDLPFDDELSTIAMRAERPAEANPQVVGAILSLSGRARRVGEHALRGVMLAAGLPPSAPLPPDAPQVIFRDDAGDPEKAVEAVDELVTIHRAVAIVGPMDARVAEAAAARAQEHGVPIVTLAAAGDPTRYGPMVFQLFATARDEVSALAARARARGASRFAALLPEGPFGDTLLKLLQGELGAAPTAVRYAPGATSFRTQVEQLVAAHPDAVLLADSSRQVSLIAPALAAGGLWSVPKGGTPGGPGAPITLLVPSVGFDASLASSVGRYLQGALFSVPHPTAEAPGSFVERYHAQFGETPDAFAAFAHDAYALVRKAVDAGAKSRADLASALLRTRLEHPAGPSPGLDANRKPSRATRILQLDGDAFVPAE